MTLLEQYPVLVGCIATVFERDFTMVDRMAEEMQAGRYHIELSDSAALQVRTAGLLKKSLKAIHALGGDYVPILTKGDIA